MYGAVVGRRSGGFGRFGIGRGGADAGILAAAAQSPGKGVLVVVPENGEDCEQLIRAGMARLKWMDWPGGRLLCLPREEDPQAQAICKILERRYPQLSLCKRDDLVYHIMDDEI